MINVIIGTKNKLYLQLFFRWLSEKDFHLLCVTDKRKEFLEVIKNYQSDIIIVGDDLYDKLFLEMWQIFQKSARIVYMGEMPTHEMSLLRIYEGVNGFLHTNMQEKAALQMLRKIHLRGYMFAPSVIRCIVDIIKTLPMHYIQGVVPARLSETELNIYRMLYEGADNVQIAEKCNLSIETVRTHRKNIYKKTGSHSLRDALRFVDQHGLFKKLESNLLTFTF